MRLLYSGAIAYLQPQPNPSASLGGFVSSSIVPNLRINSLFSDGSYFSSKNGSVETKALILENETSSGITALTIGYEYSTNPDFKIEIAIVSLTSNQLMEQIGNVRDTPYYATFSEANIDPAASPPIDNTLDIGNLAANTRLGIWIRRTQIVEAFTPVDFSIPTTSIIDAINFIIKWNA